MIQMMNSAAAMITLKTDRPGIDATVTRRTNDFDAEFFPEMLSLKVSKVFAAVENLFHAAVFCESVPLLVKELDDRRGHPEERIHAVLDDNLADEREVRMSGHRKLDRPKFFEDRKETDET